MMKENETTYIAKSVTVENRRVCLDLGDGFSFSFPSDAFDRLAKASDSQLQQVTLRVGGRALRWDSLDEDIWITDVIRRPQVLAG